MVMLSVGVVSLGGAPLVSSHLLLLLSFRSFSGWVGYVENHSSY